MAAHLSVKVSEASSSNAKEAAWKVGGPKRARAPLENPYGSTGIPNAPLLSS